MSITQMAVPICRVALSLLLSILVYARRMVSIFFFRRRAFSYFFRSASPLKPELAARNTYLCWPITFSVHVASQVTLGSCTTDFQAWPGMGHLGTTAVFATLMVI